MFNKFSPKDYPLHLSVTFSKKELELYQEIKKSLNQLPKGAVKYQNTGKVVNTFNCYFRDVDSMRPLFNNVLRQTKMYTSYILEDDKQVFTNDLLVTGNDILSSQTKTI